MARSVEELMQNATRLFTPEAQQAIREHETKQPSSVRRKPQAQPVPQPQPIYEERDSENAWETAMADLDGKIQRKQRPVNEQLQITPQAVNKSKLPDFIKQSMMQNPIGINENASVLDNADLSRFEKQMAPTQRVNEVRQTPTYSQSSIDYTIIKAIVNECLETKLKEFTQNQLNENTIKSISLKSGKITLTDHQGNVYGAKLEKIGNLNEQKS